MTQQTLCDFADGDCVSTATYVSCTTGKPYCMLHACNRCIPLPSEPAPHYPGERVLLSHPETGITVTEDLDCGGVWVGQSGEAVYLTRGAWMVMQEWMQGGSQR